MGFRRIPAGLELYKWEKSTVKIRLIRYLVLKCLFLFREKGINRIGNLLVPNNNYVKFEVIE